MKKADIIVLFNDLRADLQTAYDRYEATFGQKPDCASREFCHLDFSYVNKWDKGELEGILSNRQSLIKRWNNECDIYIHKQEMLASEEGKAFIAKLEEEREDCINEIAKANDSCKKSFNSLLETAGLDWEARKLDNLNPRYCSFDITKKSKETWPPELRISIDNEYGVPGLRMRVSSSLCGSGYLGEKSKELDQFTAYVTIHKNSALFIGWVNTVYTDLAHKVWELNLAIDKVDDQLSDPYTAWQESK